MIDCIDNKGQIDKALQIDSPEFGLETLMDNLSKQGFTRSEIYKFFIAYQIYNQQTVEWTKLEDKVGDHPVMLILDRLSGWGNQTKILLPGKPFE